MPDSAHFPTSPRQRAGPLLPVPQMPTSPAATVGAELKGHREWGLAGDLGLGPQGGGKPSPPKPSASDFDVRYRASCVGPARLTEQQSSE